MPRPGLVIFDCDGVLVDSERLTVEVEARLLTELGWALRIDEVVERFMGRSDGQMLEAVSRRLGPEAAAIFERDRSDQIRTAFVERLRPVDGVLELLGALESAGVPTCVASSGSHDKMALTLAVCGLDVRFAGRIHSADDVGRGKPAPDLFEHAARSMGVSPATCAVVEDSVPGVVAALAAGMTCWGYAGGLAGRTALEAAGATCFDHMSELIAPLS